MKKTALLLLLLVFSSLAHAQLRAGPMLGYTEMREAAIWLQTEKVSLVTFEYRKEGETKWTNISPRKSEAAKAHVLHILLEQLEPGTTYAYRFMVNGKYYGKDQPYQFKTQALWQWRSDPPDFHIAMGSCTYVNETAYDRPSRPYGGDYQIFDQIAARQPDMMLWLGDNTYLREADWSSRSGIIHRYSHGRQLPELQKLLATCPNYAIWDDHDFGPNDANGSWVHKGLSLEVFKLFWMNNGYGMPEFEGITGAFRFNDVDFFLLDNRFHRSSEQLADSCARQMLGDAQIDWLINALKFSKASFKIVAVGSQVLNSAAVYENYAQFPCERTNLLERIAKEGIKNVVFATGDRHHSELSQLEVQGILIHDITASPLSSGAGRSREEVNVNRVDGSLLLQRNFSVVEVSGKRDERVLVVKFFGSNGEELYSYRIQQQN